MEIILPWLGALVQRWQGETPLWKGGLRVAVSLIHGMENAFFR
jgi:hypothetical protein